MKVKDGKNGKKVPGNDRHWKMKRSFQNPADFEVSNLLNEIKSEFTCQRRKEFEYNTVHTYTCKMSRRKGYEKCPKEIRIIFPSDSLSVVVQETGVHHHVQKSDIADRPSVFKWSHQATKIIEQGLRNKLTPTVILNNLRENGAFGSQTEPSISVLYNKMNYMKRR